MDIQARHPRQNRFSRGFFCPSLAAARATGLAVNIVRQGFFHLILVDRDRLKPQNLGTQIWSEPEAVSVASESLIRYVIEGSNEDFTLP
jgi:hypothetical protein